jgi:hypothetical protein
VSFLDLAEGELSRNADEVSLPRLQSFLEASLKVSLESEFKVPSFDADCAHPLVRSGTSLSAPLIIHVLFFFPTNFNATD